jgi:hypothetical protein
MNELKLFVNKELFMKRVMCILLLALIGGNVQALVTIDADDPNIQYTGRINHADPKAPVMWLPGSYIIANFEGASINVSFNDFNGNGVTTQDGYAYNNYFYVIIDDGAPSLISLTAGSATYAVASGLSDTVHKIQLFKRTEGNTGEVAFEGFELENGKSLVAPPVRPSRRIEYFGDSITAGHSVQFLPGDVGNSGKAPFQDNYYTYAAVTARNLDAEYHCIAISGIGLYVDTWWSGGNMFNYYDRELNTTTWDFNRWTPQIVVINLGQNDYWGSYTQAGAEQAYVDFAQILRGHYPDAHIILALGSMTATEPVSPWPTYLQNAVDELNTTYGDAKVYSLIFPYSGNAHPDIARHAVMATQLTEFINTSIPDPWLRNGDINQDGKVNNEDFSKLSQQWQQTGRGDCQGADLTGDGHVTIDDFLVLAGNWLTS